MEQAAQFGTPILMIVFNRPDLTKKVLDSILSIRPKYLFVAADGPRANRPDDIEKCRLTRALFEQLPQEIELKMLFREQNLGCKNAVYQALDWFFSNVEEGIILEDDCLPHPDFFKFSAELLAFHRSNEKVMHISGDNFQDGRKVAEGSNSYYYSQLPHIWGWATWRRAWKYYHVAIPDLNEFVAKHKASDFGIEHYFFKKYLKNFAKVADNQIDTWDYQWHYTVWKMGGLSILPQENLITNIGFGADATHTTQIDSELSAIATKPLQFPLKHPEKIAASSEADQYTLGKLYGKNWWARIKLKLNSYLKS